MDQKIEIKEEPVWLEGIASTSFAHHEPVSGKTNLKEETKSELAYPGQTQVNIFQLCADVKDEILIEEHAVGQLVPCLKEEKGDNVENDGVFARSATDLCDSRYNVLKTGSEKKCHLSALNEQPYCSSVYQQLFSHSVEEHNNRKECNSMSSQEAELDSKMPESSERPEQHDCHGNMSSQKSNLNKPMEDSAKQYSHHCLKCGKTLSTKSHLKRHMLTHATERPYKCTECSREFSSKSNLTVHLIVHTGEKRFRYNKCFRDFSQVSYLRTHELVHSSERPHKCVECLKTFSLKRRLAAHMITHASERIHSCKECGKKFSHKYNIKKHLLWHSGERSYLCDECGKTFSQKGHLNIHKRTHSTGQPFLCHECGLLFCVKSGRREEWLNGCNHRRHLLITAV